MVFNCLHNQAPQYLVDLCQSVSSVAQDNTFALPTEVFSSCLAIISAVTVGGLFLWPALGYGTGYQTVWKTRPSAETPSNVHWRRLYFHLTCVHSALELSERCALQIHLLTLHCGNRDFELFWPNDLHIQSSPVLPGHILDVRIRTSYVKAFESYRLTNRQTDTTTIIYHVASHMVNN